VKRKKQNRLLLILLILLVIFLAAYVLLRQYNQDLEEQEAAETEESTIAFLPEDLDTSNIIGISFTSGQELLQFEYSEDTWYLSKDHNCPLDQDMMTSLQSNISSLTASREVADNLDDLASYGLDNPSNTVTVVDSNGVSATIYIGSLNSVTENYYIYMKDVDKVYTVESNFVNAFNYELTDLIQIEDVPTMSSDLLTKVTVQKSDGKWVMSYQEDGDTSLDYTATSTWFLTSPKKEVSAMDSSLSSTMTSTISSLSPESCVAYHIDDSDLKTYGLKNPAAKITVNYNEAVTVEVEDESESQESESAASESSADTSSVQSEESSEEETTQATTKTVYEPRTFTFSIGQVTNKNKETSYYLNWDGSEQIYSISEDTATYFLDLNESSFIGMTPFNILSASIDQLDVTIDKETTTYKITRSSSVDEDNKETAETTYTKNDDEITAEEFDVLYEKLNELTAEKLYSEDEADEGVTGDTVSIKVQLNNTKMKDVTFTLKPFNTNYYSVALNGTDIWLVNKIDVSNIIKKVS
jgi:hypothetical protein